MSVNPNPISTLIDHRPHYSPSSVAHARGIDHVARPPGPVVVRLVRPAPMAHAGLVEPQLSVGPAGQELVVVVALVAQVRARLAVHEVREGREDVYALGHPVFVGVSDGGGDKRF